MPESTTRDALRSVVTADDFDDSFEDVANDSLDKQNPSTSSAHAVVRAEDFDDSFGDEEADDSLDELLLATSGKQPTEQPRQMQTAAVCIDDFDDDDFGVEPTPAPAPTVTLSSKESSTSTVQLAPLFRRTSSKTATASSHTVPLVTPKFARTTSSRSKRIAVEDPNADAGHIPKVIEYDGCPEDLDLEAAKEWIYPSNVEERLYQKTIIRSALLKNVLVSLPTGLGKTFIAAVVMYNFYRWYPNGYVLFVAPTRPLVEQQIEACYNMCNFAKKDIAVLTGQMKQVDREVLWRTRRVIFMTAQTCVNDVARGAIDARRVRCVVLDEAHRATGNHSYCQLIRSISERNTKYRLMGLSATPGNNGDALQALIQTLTIEAIECRTENSPDVKRYMHGRDVSFMLCPLTPALRRYKMLLEQMIDPMVMNLCKLKVLNTGASYLTKYQIIVAKQTFERNPQRSGQFKFVSGNLAFLTSLYHMLETLEVYGARSLYAYMKEMSRSGKYMWGKVQKSVPLTELFDELEEKYRCDAPNIVGDEEDTLFDSLLDAPPAAPPTSEERKQLLEESHPKMDRLLFIVGEHFRDCEDPDKTRVMIFTGLRSSVFDICDLLKLSSLQHVRPAPFMGQGMRAGSTSGRGQKQKEQLAIMNKFKAGEFNVLVSTHVGEEGLDVGEVDLIVNFDVAVSATRSTQRMGRTGRKRHGRIVVLCTSGREEQKWKRSQDSRQTAQNALRNDSIHGPVMCRSPYMLPKSFVPACVKKNLTVNLQPYDENDARGKSEHSSRMTGKSLQKRKNSQELDKSKQPRTKRRSGNVTIGDMNK